MSRVEEIRRLLSQCTPEERREVFGTLRKSVEIHPFEKTLNTTAEVILEAISKAPDLTIRGIRGIIAEAAFVVDVATPLFKTGWRDETPKGDHPFDCALRDATGLVRVQVKLQRSKKHAPLITGAKDPNFWPGYFIAETQKTRGGKNSAGKSTRPYRFGEFDVLAVCLHPSTNSWANFLYTVADWLLPSPSDATCLRTFQPVPQKPTADWTEDFLLAVQWLRTGQTKRIAGTRK